MVNMNLLGEFERMHVSRDCLGALKAACRRLSDARGRQYQLLTHGILRHRIGGIQKGSLLIARALRSDTTAREYACLVLDRDNGEVLLPTEFSADLRTLGAAYEYQEDKLFRLHEALLWEYGPIAKGHSALDLKLEPELALALGKEFRSASAKYPNHKLIWQKWGGTLVAFRIGPLRIERILINDCTGDFEMLPMYLLR